MAIIKNIINIRRQYGKDNQWHDHLWIIRLLFNNEAIIRPKAVKLITRIPRCILKKLIARKVSQYKL